jgi:hypothetical protein
MNLCECGCGGYCNFRFIQGHHLIGNRNPMKNPKVRAKHKRSVSSLEVRQRMSRSRMGRVVREETRKIIRDKQKAEKCKLWKGGCSSWWHREAAKLFFHNHCELCGLSNEEHKQLHPRNARLSMHCRDNDPTNLSEENWVTVCEFGCHQRLDNIDRI